MRRVLLLCALVALAVPIASFAGGDDPVITVPANMTVEAQNFSGATVTYTASAVDRRGRFIPVTCTPPSGTIFGFGPTTVTCTARDSEGRTSVKRFQVTVVDRTPPAITVPAGLRVNTTRRTGKIVAYTASASDLVDGSVGVNCSPKSGVAYAVGVTTVSCSAADRRGNASSKAFQVTVVYTRSRSAKNAAMLAPAQGAKVTAPPMLRWRSVPHATIYNAQLYRRGRKVLTAWPTRARLRLSRQWTFSGRTYRLKPGPYTWLVWPGFGSPSHPRYGKLLGQSSFIYAARG
jgi:HYR domain-containing protein